MRPRELKPLERIWNVFGDAMCLQGPGEIDNLASVSTKHLRLSFAWMYLPFGDELALNASKVR
jgi:hypothetical protein